MKIAREKLIYEINNRIISTNQQEKIQQQCSTISPTIVDEIVNLAVKTYKDNLIERVGMSDFGN